MLRAFLDCSRCPSRRPGARRGQLGIGLTLALFLSTASACQSGAAPASDSVTNGAEEIRVDYVVPATPENLSWGWFPVDKAPVITVRPGDVVEMHTLTGFGASGGSEPVTNLGEIGIAASEVPEELVAFWRTHTSRPREGRNGHLITGPVYVEGAEPGDVLEVEILDVRPLVPWGVNFTLARSGVLSASYPGYRAGDPPLDIPPAAPDQEPEDFHIIRTVTVEGRDYGEWDSGVRVPRRGRTRREAFRTTWKIRRQSRCQAPYRWNERLPPGLPSWRPVLCRRPARCAG
jgi:hypothetical protein